MCSLLFGQAGSVKEAEFVALDEHFVLEEKLVAGGGKDAEHDAEDHGLNKCFCGYADLREDGNKGYEVNAGNRW